MLKVFIFFGEKSMDLLLLSWNKFVIMFSKNFEKLDKISGSFVVKIWSRILYVLAKKVWNCSCCAEIILRSCYLKIIRSCSRVLLLLQKEIWIFLRPVKKVCYPGFYEVRRIWISSRPIKRFSLYCRGKYIPFIVKLKEMVDLSSQDNCELELYGCWSKISLFSTRNISFAERS